MPVGAIRASLAADGKTDTDPRGNTRKKFMDWVKWDGQTAVAKNVDMKVIYRLMGFSDDIRYPDDIRDACRLAGNAVPPILMKKVVETIVWLHEK
jgi:hypothetical protein